MSYDAFFFVSFGGPERPEDVAPFLDNVLRGKNVPGARKQEVAQHYTNFGGKSPINDQNRELIAKLGKAFKRNQIDLPIYWGNRNWSPYIKDALAEMKADGKKHALAYFTSTFSSYSGCRQYRENIKQAQEELGMDAPEVSKLRMGFNHPLFIQAAVESIQEAYQTLLHAEKDKPKLLFTAHSIPLAMSENCDYVKQLKNACALTAQRAGFSAYELVYQSRSGPPQMPWLEPDICDALSSVKIEGFDSVLVLPIGFITDHIEILYDLDTEARQKADEIGLGFARGKAVGHFQLLVDMIVDLVQERRGQHATRKALGELGPWHDQCPPDCCTYSPRRPSR